MAENVNTPEARDVHRIVDHIIVVADAVRDLAQIDTAWAHEYARIAGLLVERAGSHVPPNTEA